MGTRTGQGLAFWMLAPLVILTFGVETARGQTPVAGEEPALRGFDCHFPTNRNRIRSSLRDTIGFHALLPSALEAGTNQIANGPPEWGQGTAGYGRRLASRFGRLAIQNRTELGLGVALHQDLSYRRCDCNGFLHRTGHALISNFTARAEDGRRTFTFARVASHYAGAMISTTWYPDRYTATGDGIRLGTLSLASSTASNLIREFWPEMRRLFHR